MKKILSKFIVIIGAGPCGLGAAWRLKEIGFNDYILIEKENCVGGLSKSIKDKSGFIWDLGAHIIFSKYQYFNKFINTILGSNYLKHRRSAWIHMLNRYIPYPFQYNLRFLPKEIADYCLLEIKKTKINNNAKNYYDWVYQNYGKGISDYFKIPYAKKIWSYSPKLMNFSWVKERVAPADKKRIINSFYDKSKDSSWGPNNNFIYPYNGNGELWNKAAIKIQNKILLSKKIVQINYKKRIVTLNDKTQFEYQYLLTTTPINILLKIISDKTELLKRKNPLKYSSILLFGFKIKEKLPICLKNKLWVYYPEKEVSFFRGTVISKLSPNSAPKNYWSFLTETSFTPTKKLNIYKEKQRVVKSLIKLKYISNKKQIKSTWHYLIKHAYPIPTLDRNDFLKKIVPFLEKEHIYTRGRFGYWKYEISNQDHSFMQGVEWVNELSKKSY